MLGRHPSEWVVQTVWQSKHLILSTDLCRNGYVTMEKIKSVKIILKKTESTKNYTVWLTMLKIKLTVLKKTMIWGNRRL